MKAAIFIAVFLCAASAISGAAIADSQKVVCEDAVRECWRRYGPWKVSFPAIRDVPGADGSLEVSDA